MNRKKLSIKVAASLACFFYLMLMGCSVYSETKAPCNYEGSFCGTKMAING